MEAERGTGKERTFWGKTVAREKVHKKAKLMGEV